MIDIDKQIKYWQAGAESDLETAEILIVNKKYVQGLFFCHLCIEKIIKALIVKKTKQIPPKSHDLFYLSEKASIALPEEHEMFMQILMKYQLEGRYPEYYPTAPLIEKINNYLCETKELLKWFSKKLLT